MKCLNADLIAKGLSVDYIPQNPIRKDLGIASWISPVNFIVLVSYFRIPQFSPLYLIEPLYYTNNVRGFYIPCIP
jgi:hypothetical protein